MKHVKCKHENKVYLADEWHKPEWCPNCGAVNEWNDKWRYPKIAEIKKDKVTDEMIDSWAIRHDIKYRINDLRLIFEDATSISHTNSK